MDAARKHEQNKKKIMIEPKLHPSKVGKTVKKVIFTGFVCSFELPTLDQSVSFHLLVIKL